MDLVNGYDKYGKKLVCLVVESSARPTGDREISG